MKRTIHLSPNVIFAVRCKSHAKITHGSSTVLEFYGDRTGHLIETASLLRCRDNPKLPRSNHRTRAHCSSVCRIGRRWSAAPGRGIGQEGKQARYTEFR